jgi:hypothetical protein
MKKFLVLLLILGCGAPSQQQDPLQTVKDFLNWYGVHYKEATSFGFVNQGNGVNYSVNFTETEKFLSYMKSSGFVSEAYLSNFRKYFKEAEEDFKKDPINEGPPPGFDYDIVLFTQEPELVIEKANNPIVILSEVHDDVATLNLNVDMKLQFMLSRDEKGWKIDQIRNLGE